MTPDDYYNQIVPDYFLDEQHDVLKPLPQDEYSHLIGMIEQAIDEYPDDCAFWFWKGWALQFYSSDHEGLPRHPHFELIEDAYEHVVELDSRRIEAHFMLTYLYWDSVKRFNVSHPDYTPTTDEQEHTIEIVDFEEARRQMNLFLRGDSSSMMQGEAWRLYPFETPAWSVLLKPMIDDVVGADWLPVLYLEWGWGWEHRGAYDQLQDAQRLEAFREARWAFATGARLEGIFSLDCQAALARNHSPQRGGDPVKGISEYRKLAEMLVGSTTDVRNEFVVVGRDGHLLFGGNYHPSDLEEFLTASPMLEQRHDTADFVREMEAAGLFDPADPESAKLAWYLGRCYLHRKEWDKAEHYLSLAYRKMAKEPDLILQLATAKDEQGKSDDSARVLLNLPGNTLEQLRLLRLAERDLVRSEFMRSVERLPASIDLLIGKIDTVYGLVNNLGETLTSAIQNFHMPDVSSVGQGNLDVDELAARVAQEVGNQFAAIVAEKPALFDNIRQKCDRDLYNAWSVFPLELQEQIVVGETMHILFSEYSIPEYGALIVQWGKITESMMRLGILMPMAGYLDKINHRSSVLLKVPTSKGKFMTNQVDVPPSGKSWSQPVSALKFSESLGLLFEARDRRDKHAIYGFLTHIGAGQSHIDLLLSQVPDHIDQIREYRNKAAHFATRYYLEDALNVRCILFTRGLIAEMAFLLECAKSAGLAPK